MLEDLPNLGIISGNGLLPLEISSLYTNAGGKCYVAAIKGEANKELPIHPNCRVENFSMGSVGAIIEYFKNSNVNHIIFVGGIQRPNLKDIKVDVTGSVLLTKLLAQKFLGDDNVLKTIANFFENKGFKIVSAQDVMALSQLQEDTAYSIKKPTKTDVSDIELGFKVLTALGSVDVGQSVIVQEGYVLGIEAAEGTDNLITRCANLRKSPSGGVLVKMMKQGQDTRLDIPSIGPDTITNLAQYNYSGLAIQKSGVLIINKPSTMELLNAHKLFLVQI